MGGERVLPFNVGKSLVGVFVHYGSFEDSVREGHKKESSWTFLIS